MRHIILDTETTGLNANSGDRVIEIGCVEMVNRRLTGRTFHCYINPQREIDAGAIAVHGITNEFLADKPVFADIVNELRDFTEGATLIIHNASFDLGFLDAEFRRLELAPFREQIGGVIDTLLEARQMFPGKRNSLDALCDRLGVSNAHRTLHGALLDAELLAEVYLAMTRGQNSLVIELSEGAQDSQTQTAKVDFSQLTLPILAANREEMAAHEALLSELDKAGKKPCVWRAEPETATPASHSSVPSAETAQ